MALHFSDTPTHVHTCRGKDEALQLAVMLWQEGFVSTVPASARLPALQPQQRQHAKGSHKGILTGVQHSKGVRDGAPAVVRCVYCACTSQVH